MQKEDLLRRIKIFATVATTAFVILIITLIVQFGFIAYNNAQLSRLQEENAQKQAQLEEAQKEASYWENLAKGYIYF